MDVVNAISCVFLFIAAGPFLEKLFWDKGVLYATLISKRLSHSH